ncbi:MAG: protein translocase subunit SecF [Chlorobi bacterium CHB2]|nr:protein translocase subunit SecF [Chlorobi bacterium CHB2]
MQFFSNTHIDFIGKRRFFYWVSAVITVAGLIAAFIRGVEFGIDFEGGTEAAFKFAKVIPLDEIRTAVDNAGFKGSELKSYGGDDKVLIRVKQEAATVSTGEANKLARTLQEKLQSAFPDNPMTLLKVDNIGPKVGQEMRGKALLAVIVSVIAILLYITFRFEFLFGLGAVIALVHDVLVAFALAVIFNGVFGLNLEMNMGMLAAFLTVVGFSINDTVIIFDRIRENRKLHRGENLMMLMNRSINETLPRTINTSLTVALVLVILLLFSGEVLNGFAFTMLVGIITGTYSSIYIASAFVISVLVKQGKLDPRAERDFAEHTQRLIEETRQRKAAALAR